MARIFNFSDLAVTATDDASHSATLTEYQGDLAFSGLVPGGRTPNRAESQGAYTGSRKGARAYPTVSFSGHIRGNASAMDNFTKLVSGLTSGFVSVTDSISDMPATNLDLTWTHNAVTHTAVCEDCELDSFDESDGEFLTRSWTFTILGPVTIDSETFISSR